MSYQEWFIFAPLTESDRWSVTFSLGQRKLLYVCASSTVSEERLYKAMQLEKFSQEAEGPPSSDADV